MLSPYRIPSKSNKKNQKISKTEHEPKRTQMSSNDPVINSVTETIKPVKTENKLKGGGNFEFDDEYLDEILHDNSL